MGGVGTFDCEFTLLHDQSVGDKDSNRGQRWISVEWRCAMVPTVLMTVQMILLSSS